MKSHSAEATAAFENFVASRDEIIECYSMSGDWDYLLRILVADVEDYNRFLMRTVLRHPAVATGSSHFALAQVKYTTAVPLWFESYQDRAGFFARTVRFPCIRGPVMRSICRLRLGRAGWCRCDYRHCRWGEGPTAHMGTSTRRQPGWTISCGAWRRAASVLTKPDSGRTPTATRTRVMAWSSVRVTAELLSARSPGGAGAGLLHWRGTCRPAGAIAPPAQAARRKPAGWRARLLAWVDKVAYLGVGASA